MRPTYWTRALAELGTRDRVLGGIIASYPGEALEGRGDPFTTLARSILGQQISVKAADSLWRRLEATLTAINPATLAAASPDDLRAAGLSRQKASYLADLGRGFRDGSLKPAGWRRRDDEAVIAELTKFRGIGRWTAEMFLIFNLQRPDVLPLDDVGLRRAVGLHYGHDGPVTKDVLAEIAGPWRPWRSVATWYLWRSLDPLPVSY